MRLYIVIGVIILLKISPINSYSNGAPAIACGTLTPSKSFHGAAPQPISTLTFVVSVKPLSDSAFSCKLIGVFDLDDIESI